MFHDSHVATSSDASPHPTHPFFTGAGFYEEETPWDAMIDPSHERSSPPAIEPAIEGDVDDDEFDELSWNEQLLAEAQSITSSVMRHEYENGRRFHKFRHGRYPLPNDDEEQDRDVVKHAMTLELTNGKLFFAPIPSHPQRIIDLGTGTGAWAIEVADLYPSAEVLGIDLSPIQPSWVPPNLEFIVDDFEDDVWMHGSDFDLIHLRHVCPSIKNISTVLETSFDNLRSGGFIEIQEFGGVLLCDDGTMQDDFAPKRFMDLLEQAIANFGGDFRLSNKLEEPLVAAGFSNIQCRTIRAPVGTWPKGKTLRLAGFYLANALRDLFTAMSSRALTTLDLKTEEITWLLDQAIEGLDDRRTHTYLNYFFWTAQKL